ncbi:MAG TPA: putative PEP-binding protein [Streptosporangiaceae bacterium]
MTQPTRFAGLPVSDGVAAGVVYQADVPAAADATAEQVASAFAAVAAGRFELAAKLRSAGRADEADIIEVAALIAADPALVEPALAAIRTGTDAATAVIDAAQAQAAILAALPSTELASRAGDVRQIGQAVLEHLAGGRAAPPAGDFILIRHEVAAADLVELAEAGLAGAASVAGGASSHAAIVARGLGVPMITGVDPAVLTLTAWQTAVVDADAGTLLVDPPKATLDAITARPTDSIHQPVSGKPKPQTSDHFQINLLVNVASRAETRRGLAAGAAGVGLLRTEIPFAETALAWPTADEHAAQLSPILNLLAGRPTTVRLLDFSGDKIPPFLRSGSKQGLAALLAHPAAITDQLDAALDAGRDTDLAILVPMVSSPSEVETIRELLIASAARLGLASAPQLGIMVELEATAADAAAFTAADFFSIGTNDLTGQVLGLDRRDLAASPARAADPVVLRLIGHVTDVADEAGLPVSVCGDAAADSLLLPLLLGLGVRTLSVPAARVDRVRTALSKLSIAECSSIAAKALAAETSTQVTELVRRAELS